MPRDNGRGGEARGGRPFRSLSPQFAAYLRHYWLVNSPSSEIGAGEGPKNLAQSKFPLTQNNATRPARSMVRRGGSMLGWDFVDGSNRLVAESPTTSGENLGKNMSVGVWCRPNNHADEKDLISKGEWNATNINFRLHLTSSGPSPQPYFGFQVGGVWKFALSPEAIPLTFPATLLVGTYDGATIKMYVNGKLMASVAESGTPDTNANDIAIGSTFSGAYGATGSEFSHAFIFNRALHHGEILRLASMGPDAFLIPDVLYPPVAPPPPPAATPYRGWGSLPTPISQTNSGLHGPVIFPGTGPLDGVYH